MKSRIRNQVTQQSVLAHTIRPTWSKIPFWIMPCKMKLSDGRSIRPDQVQKELQQAAQKLLDEAFSKKHMLRHLYEGLGDDKGLAAGTQQRYREALTTAITGALTHVLKEKLSTSGKGIVQTGVSSLAFAGFVGASVALSMSSLDHGAVVGIGFLLACCFIACVATFWNGCPKNNSAPSWYKKLSSDTPGEAMDAKTLKKVADAISEATQAFEIPKSHRERFAITKTHIKNQMSQWKSWEPELKVDWRAHAYLYDFKRARERAQRAGIGTVAAFPVPFI